MKTIFRILTLFLLAAAPLSAQDPERIIEGARHAAALVEIEEGLQGSLTKGRDRTPITLFLRGENIQFQFTERGKPLSTFHIRIGENNHDLFEIVNGKTVRFPAAKIVQPIANTDLTYEDLALRFFQWPDPIYERIENVGGQACHKIRINKPRNSAGQYESVYVWVHTKFGAFMRIRGHDKNGGLVKEFQVEDVMQVSKDVWTLRKMQVATHDPKSGRRLSITTVTFNAPRKAALRGLR